MLALSARLRLHLLHCPSPFSPACSPAENSNKLFGVAVGVSSVIALFTFSLSLAAAEQLVLIS